MKTIAFIICFIFFNSCTKEYNPQIPISPDPEIKVTITGITYVTSVNGSTGEYWKITVSISKPIDKGIHIVYSFDDAFTKGMTISHWLDKSTISNVFFTQYSAKGNISNIRLIRVDGANEYKFKL